MSPPSSRSNSISKTGAGAARQTSPPDSSPAATPPPQLTAPAPAGGLKDRVAFGGGNVGLGEPDRRLRDSRPVRRLPGRGFLGPPTKRVVRRLCEKPLLLCRRPLRGFRQRGQEEDVKARGLKELSHLTVS